MQTKRKLRGWGEIETWLGLTRNTVVARGYPVYRTGGGVWAVPEELERWERQHAAPVGAKAAARPNG